ncbi:MAG: DEAD/DEAH box helicase [Candidatus Eremiobacteraeota bacterium]|nr:DEAD/DEAH box helicase [Candidatus Eremiobacteraeota bacterium]
MKDNFEALGLNPALVSAASALGYEEPTEIQKEAIPALLAHRDVLGQAATGTGKTAAFALPMLHHIGPPNGEQRKVRGLILVPTRELAMQVAEAVHKYGRLLEVSVLPIYGGSSLSQQLRALRRGIDVVVATPGRALDHIGRGTLDLAALEFLVLDEADEMLDMGFADELEAIMKAVPTQRQTALFSATLAPRIRSIAKKYLRDPLLVTIANETAAPGKQPRIREVAYVVQRAHKAAALARVIDMEAPTSAIVFCRTRTEVDELTQTLGARGYQAEAIHGGLSQDQRDRVLRRFRDGTSEILVATDVAARGLDIEHLSHVVNFDVPSSPDAYVHRIGRTGRAGREGVAITLAEAREHRLLRNIETHTKRKISVQAVPSVHDLRARRLDQTRTSLEEALQTDDLDQYRPIVESLAADHDILDLAAAAVKLLDVARGGGQPDHADIPSITTFLLPKEANKTSGKKRSGGGDFVKLYVGLGRNFGIRPTDLVGAIANEARLDSREIGSIDIADKFSLVEVPASKATAIITALRGTTIRGKKVSARLDRGK